MEPKVAKTETDDLRAFCLVADHGSITAAARILGETKGSVSRRISRLERSLGIALLRRSPRLVRPTDDGAAYRERVGRVLELLDDANDNVRQSVSVPTGHLRVTAPMDLASSVLAPLVADFAAQFPKVTIEMVLTEQILDFDANQIDVALRATGPLPDSSLIAHRLAELTSGLYASPGYLSEHGTPAEPAALADHRMLRRASRPASTLSLHPQQGPDVAIRVGAAVMSSEFHFLKEVCVAGGGIGVLPDAIAAAAVTEGRLVRVLSEYTLQSSSLYLLYPGTRFLTPKLRAFRDFLRQAFRK